MIHSTQFVNITYTPPVLAPLPLPQQISVVSRYV